VELERRHAELEHAIDGRVSLIRRVSHDLKNPMHAIAGHAAFLADGLLGRLSPAQEDSAVLIRRGVRSLLALVDALMELARGEAGQLRVTPHRADLAALLRERSKNIARQSEGRVTT
jgi:signal transduction histidine kinase